MMEQTPTEYPGRAKPLVGAVGYPMMIGWCPYPPGAHLPQATQAPQVRQRDSDHRTPTASPCHVCPDDAQPSEAVSLNWWWVRVCPRASPTGLMTIGQSEPKLLRATLLFPSRVLGQGNGEVGSLCFYKPFYISMERSIHNRALSSLASSTRL